MKFYSKAPMPADTVFTNTPEALRELNIEKAPTTEAPNGPDTLYRDGQIANLSTAMLREHPIDGQPFFLAVGFWRPHLPFVAPKKYWDLVDPMKIPMPSPAAKPAGAPDIAMHESREIRSYGTTPQDRPFTEKEIRHFRHGYYASITFMDAQIGKILDALEAGGHADDTIVVFTSDHGFHIGEQSLWGKTSNFELDARVPLIIADPRVSNSQGAVTDSLAELLDLYPTLAEMAGIDDNLSQRLEGVSLAPVIQDPTTSVQDAVFTQHQQPFHGSPSKWQAWGYSIRTADRRYTEWRAIEDGSIIAHELYDHSIDPGETKNLSKAREQEVNQLAEKLATQFPKTSQN